MATDDQPNAVTTVKPSTEEWGEDWGDVTEQFEIQDLLRTHLTDLVASEI
jgi:hypothetical protein